MRTGEAAVNTALNGLMQQQRTAGQHQLIISIAIWLGALAVAALAIWSSCVVSSGR